MYKETIINDDPVGFWILDDNIHGDTLKDYSKYGADGSLGGGFALKFGKVGFSGGSIGPDPDIVRSISTTTNFNSHCGINTHFSTYAHSNYRAGANHNSTTTINPDVVPVLTQLGVTLYRERHGNNNPIQVDAMDKLGPGIRIYATPGILSMTITQVKGVIAFLAAQSRARGYNVIRAVCGPNEINAKNNDGTRTWGTTWAADSKTFMQWCRAQVDLETWPETKPLVVAPALKHNGVPLDADIAELAGQNLQTICDAGDFHFYAGNNGPGYRMNGKDSNGNIPPGLTVDSDGKVAVEKFELYRHYQIFNWSGTGSPPVFCHSEWGWTTNQTPDNIAGPLAPETYLRDFNLGIKYSVMYECINEKPYLSDPAEGNFGVYDVNATPGPKATFNTVAQLLNYTGSEEINGKVWLVDISGVVSDCGVNAFSLGSGKWDIYLTRNAQTTVHVVTDPAYQLVDYVLDPGGYYVVNLASSMTVIQVIPNATPPTWVQDSPTDAIISVPYTYTFIATNSPAYSVVAGVGTGLPTGLSLNGSTGVLSGTPTVVGKFTFKIQAQNSAGTILSPLLTMHTQGPPVWLHDTPPGGTVGITLSYQFVATGYPKITYSILTGAIPSGLTFDTVTGILSGTPDTAATYNFVVRANNARGHVDTPTITIVIAGGSGTPSPPVFVLDDPPSTGKVGILYDYLFTATGYPDPTFILLDYLIHVPEWIET